MWVGALQLSILFIRAEKTKKNIKKPRQDKQKF